VSDTTSPLELPHVAPDEFRAAIRHLAGGVVIIASGSGADRRGLTATAACSLSTDPPSILVCVNRTAEAHDVITQTRSFSVNVLTSDHVELANKFAGRDGSKGAIRFAQELWSTLATGTPVLADAISAFDCSLFETCETKTHTVFIGRVVGVAARSVATPLLYHNGRYGVVAHVEG
jgi:flavin reductase (DIM6/NTAB) family NADH-FMN oxidoreductase RutF